jgi:hypothetical protein
MSATGSPAGLLLLLLLLHLPLLGLGGDLVPVRELLEELDNLAELAELGRRLLGQALGFERSHALERRFEQEDTSAPGRCRRHPKT